MENTKAKNIIITILIILIVVVAGIFVYYKTLNTLDKQTVKQTTENIKDIQEEIEKVEKNEEEQNIKKDIANAIVTGIVDKWNTGNEVKQSIKVTLNEKILIDEEDYTVSYKDNVDPGMAIMTVTGLGEYVGSKDVTFEIKDQYEKYKDKSIKWATSSSSFNNNSNINISMENNKVYLANIISAKFEVKGFSRNTKKVIHTT